MGIDPVTAVLGASTVVSGITGARQARKAARSAQRGMDAAQQRLQAAPGEAQAYAQGLLDEYGRPMYGAAEFYGVGPEGADAKARAIYQQQMGLLQPQLEDEKRAIEQRMLAQGMPSSLVTEAMREVEGKYALAGQQAALMGTMAGVDLQAQEAARHTQFGLIEGERRFLEGQYPIGLAAGLLPSFMGSAQAGMQGAAASGQMGMQGVQQAQESYAGMGAGLGGLYSNYQNYTMGNRYLDILAGRQAGGGVDNFLNNYQSRSLPFGDDSALWPDYTTSGQQTYDFLNNYPGLRK